MSSNVNLFQAFCNKQDEFYTQLEDIERELYHYWEHFRGKVVYCNCDDPTRSNFWKYFSLKFEALGLKKLMATCYKNPQFEIFSDYTPERSYYFEYLGDEINQRFLKGDGDFRSDECIELLKEADIIVTNPPFSLFREYVAQLIKYDKKFIVIGNQNAAIYKDIFPLIRDNKIWYGVSISGNLEFGVPDHYPLTTNNSRIDSEGRKFVRVNGVRWFTNLDHKRRKEEMILYKKYTSEEYPHYDNYDAIEVGTTRYIPYDWAGVMGVPITFLDSFNPVQFEILGSNNGLNQDKNGVYGRFSYIKRTATFSRIFIRNKQLNSTHDQLALC